jgi:hypothetical protein
MSPSRKLNRKISCMRFVQFIKDRGREPVKEFVRRIRYFNLESFPLFSSSLPLNLLPDNSRLVSLVRFTMSLLIGHERLLKCKQISSNPVTLCIS